MQTRRRAFVLAACAVVAAAILAPLTQSPASAADGLSGRLSAALGRAGKSVRITAGVWDVATGSLIHQAESGAARRPASVTKVATTAAAFLALGPDHELTTEILATAKPDSQGVVTGSLVVRGHGDPGFAAHFDPRGAEAALRDFAKQVRAAGVSRVTGDLVLDATAFPGPERHPSWGWADGEWGWDQAPVSALVLNDNCIDLQFRTGPGAGAPTQVSVLPATTVISFTNRVSTGAAKTKSLIALGRTQPDGRIPLTGTAAAGDPVKVADQACVDPVLFFGDVLQRVLAEEGVAVAGRLVPVRSPAATGAGPRVGAASAESLVPLAKHGTKVSAIAAVANANSQNLYAELLCRELGRVKAGDGSFSGGCRVVADVLGFAQGDAAFRMSDGCGLSRENQMTAAAVGKVLLSMSRAPTAKAFMLTLARPGEEGTLQRRFRESKFKGRVLAKTGTLRDTKALAGYVLGKSGRQYAFAVLCEGDNGRAIEIQDALVEALVDE